MQLFLLEAEVMPPPLPSLAVQESCTFPQCFSKNCCQPQGKNPVAPQWGANNHHPHHHFKWNALTKEKCGGRGAVTEPALCGSVYVCAVLWHTLPSLFFFLIFLPFHVRKVKVMKKKLKIIRKSTATGEISREMHKFSTNSHIRLLFALPFWSGWLL